MNLLRGCFLILIALVLGILCLLFWTSDEWEAAQREANS